MSATSSSVITDWKRLWQLVSGIHHETPESTVQEELLNVSQELQDGVLQFKPTSASTIKLEALLKEKKQEKLLPFTYCLQDLLDLESSQCWEILCYYLANEYRGSASSLAILTSTESNMTKLLDDIWGYYTLERMIVLKIVKNLLVFYRVADHPYHREYRQVVDRITMEKLRESYLKQLEHLVNEAPPHKLAAGEFFDFHSKLVNWSERNAREIVEVLHILLLICEHMPAGLAEIKRLFGCFKQHSFGRQQNYLDSSRSLHAELVARLTYAELALFLRCIDFEDATASAGLARDLVEALDKDVGRMRHNPEDGPLLFGWMMMQIRCTNAADEEASLLRCRQFGKRAVDLNCFSYMHRMLVNAMFKDDSLVSRIVRKTIYNLLSHMCDYFDGDGSCSRHPYIYELLSELLSWPPLAKEFCSDEDGGVHSLFNTLLEIFPIDFVHISMLANALTKAGMGSYIRSQLESLPVLTDLYDENKYSLRAAAEDEFVLLHSVQPFPGIEFCIPGGTAAVVMSRPEGYCVHFRTTVNYFNVLHHEMNCLLAETMQLYGDFESSGRVRRVCEGIRYLHSTLQRTKALTAISTEMVRPTEMCIDLLNKFKQVQTPPMALLASCLNVCTALLPLVETEIFMRVTNLSILPVITNDILGDYKKYAHGLCFDPRLVGSYLVDVEKKRERFDFLESYISFLRAYTKLQRCRYFEMEIPGLVFLLRDVFPHLHSFRFESQQAKYKIYAEIMGFICDILDVVTSTTGKDEETPSQQQQQQQQQRELLRNICVYSLLNMENGLILLRFVGLGNAYLQHTMEMESNWMLQQSHGLVLLVRLAMRILMQVLRLKGAIFKSSELSPLEAMIYTQPKQRDTLRIIAVVTGYMNNIFDRWLPILSCRLLKRIALEFNMSLLACLDMEPDQIRLTFLQKLPDELESDSLKIAILELVEACIEKQPGVTEAFFKVNYGQERRLFGKEANAQIADSIITYIEDYLEAVGKEPHIVAQMLPSKVMNLFHSLWMHNMQMLVEELTKKPSFWEKLCNPLFSDLQADVHAYAQLFNILAIEIFYTPTKENASLEKVVLKFFESSCFERWLDFVFNMPKTPYLPHSRDGLDEEIPEWLCRLQAFKGFLLILLKKQPQYVEIPAKQLKLLAEKCLTVLVEHAEYGEDLRPFILLSELYLFIVLSFKRSYTESADEDRRILGQLVQLLGRVASCYRDLHIRAKEACLAITIRCGNLLAEELVNEPTVGQSFLHSVVSIICSELQDLENCVKAEVRAKKPVESTPTSGSSNALILSLNLLRTVAIVFEDNGPGNWDSPFNSNKVFQRLLSCTSAILPLYSKQQLSVELLDVLIVFAKGNCSAEFLHCDVGDYLWLKLLPPKELLQLNYTLSTPRPEDWSVEKWWPIYARGIELVTLLFQKHKHQFLKDVLQFVGIHEEYLVDSLLLGKQSLEPLAMNLIKCAIMLLSELVKYEKQWRLDHSESMFNLMRSVQMLLGHSISMFHQPKNLKCLIAGRRSQLDIMRDSEGGALVDEVITSFNDLTEIIILCVKCLQRFSPRLLDLICEPEFLASKWEPILEIHFGAPKLTETAFTLTFGTVLSIVSFYTKVLNLQNYGFHEVPLNVLPSTGSANTESPTDRGVNGQMAVNTTRRPFSKSLSVTSASSVNCPNELLLNLDGELCLVALEHILSLAASQSMLALKNHLLPAREKQLIRREISTELLCFHEFVRKKVLIEYREHKSIWQRRKHGQVLMQQIAIGTETENDDDDGERDRAPTGGVGGGGGGGGTVPSRRSGSDLRNSMRVNVTRRLHLQHQQQHQQQQQHQLEQQQPQSLAQQRPLGGDEYFEMSHIISPIGIRGHGAQPTASTPHLARPPIRRQDELAADPAQRLYPELETHFRAEAEVLAVPDDEEIVYFPPEEPMYSPLSYIQFVEEDYLHFLSNLFFVICQND